jgi:hypothetical protein
LTSAKELAHDARAQGEEVGFQNLAADVTAQTFDFEVGQGQEPFPVRAVRRHLRCSYRNLVSVFPDRDITVRVRIDGGRQAQQHGLFSAVSTRYFIEQRHFFFVVDDDTTEFRHALPFQVQSRDLLLP